MTNKDNRTPLRKAVDWLISEGKIQQDKDLQQIFGLSKSTISAYLTGKPGKRFVNDFQKKFELSLERFEDEEKNLLHENGVSYQKTSQTETEVIELLKSQIRMLENHCTFVQKMYEDIKNKTDVNLNEALSNQRVMMRQIAVESHLAAQRFAGNDKKKFQAELDKIDKLITAGM